MSLFSASANTPTNPAAPLTITATGSALRSRRAERAVLTATVSTESPSAEEAAAELTEVSKVLQTHARELRASGPGGAGVARDASTPVDAPLTDWSMGALSTTSYQIPAPRGAMQSAMPGAMQFSTTQETTRHEPGTRMHKRSVGFTMRFSDFGALSSTVERLGVMDAVTINGVSWHLLEATRLALEKETRMGAVKDARSKAEDFAEAAVGSREVRMLNLDDRGVQVFESGQTQGGTRQQHGSLFGNVGGGFGGGQQVMQGVPGAIGVARQDEGQGFNLEPGNLRVQWEVWTKFVIPEKTS